MVEKNNNEPFDQAKQAMCEIDDFMRLNLDSRSHKMDCLRARSLGVSSAIKIAILEQQLRTNQEKMLSRWDCKKH
jgi:hypothetical protein